MSIEDFWAIVIGAVVSVTALLVGLLVVKLLARPPKNDGHLTGKRTIIIVSIMVIINFMAGCMAVYIYMPEIMPGWVFIILLFLVMLAGIGTSVQLYFSQLIRTYLFKMVPKSSNTEQDTHNQ